MQASYRCLPISLTLRGVEFEISPIVGMDWMKQ